MKIAVTMVETATFRQSFDLADLAARLGAEPTEAAVMAALEDPDHQDSTYGIQGATWLLDGTLEAAPTITDREWTFTPRADEPCRTCALHGLMNCRETVGTCDLCGQEGDVYMDYSKSGDREQPDETVCLDCLSAGAHIKAAHEQEGESGGDDGA